MRRKHIAFVTLVLLGALALAAQDSRLLVSRDDTLHSVLSRHVSKSVTLKLDSGEELTGKVRLVGDRIVHLQELSGKEFFDAIVELEDVEAILVRNR